MKSSPLSRARNAAIQTGLRSILLAVLSVTVFAAQAAPDSWSRFAQSHVLVGRATEGPLTGATTSEGQGVAMLQAVHAGDRAAFDALWTFAQVRLQQASGLLAWKWESKGGVIDSNNASLGDVYVAWALQAAATKWNWPAYAVQAERIADALLDKCVAQREGKAFLLPAATGYANELKGSSDLSLNPSHWALPAFKSFERFERGAEWRAVYASAVDALPRIAEANGQRVPTLVSWSRGQPRTAKNTERDGSERVAVFLLWTKELPTLQASLANPNLGRDSSLYSAGLRFLTEQAQAAGN